MLLNSSTLLDKVELHAICTQRNRTLRNCGTGPVIMVVFSLFLFKSHFHFDTGNKVTGFLASVSRADLEKLFPVGKKKKEKENH